MSRGWGGARFSASVVRAAPVANLAEDPMAVVFVLLFLILFQECGGGFVGAAVAAGEFGAAPRAQQEA